MRKFLFFIFIVGIVSLQACNSSNTKKETTKEPTQPKSFSELTFLDITPLADGGAYATDDGGSLWYLKGSEAIKVKEVSQLSVQPSSLLSSKREKALWVFLQRERSKRKSAEAELDNYTNPPEDSYEPDTGY